MKRYVFTIFIAVVLILIAIIQTWIAYQPKVGPVGNGPNDAVIWTNFTWQLFTGICFLTVGIIGIYKSKKTELNGDVKQSDS
ncbi:hypothetical protein EHS13_17690 [Paenibacillus psychroresistens]|uniref:Uncharacterized protein n=1 Tax=Paenibacillus psychroresistens TaxID=1778678 RepID=A0A6B8RKL5_9BACL|nr:hypothetical protein [Paenibacillus psychroresistens]QGQ96579.1 hypothetical protein EHS13_17690 [Paenibacillus psychroresistens]